MEESKIKLSPDGKTVYEVYDVDNLVIPEGVTKIDKCAATQRMIVTVEIPDSVEEIGKEAFRICRDLQSVTIGAGVKKMGNEAFAGCNKLKTVTIREGAKVVGADAFTRCEALENISLPSTLTKIGAFAFSRCTALTSIVIPAKVKTLGELAFSGCSALKSVTILSGAVTGETFLMAINNCPVEVVRIPAAFVDKFKETFTADISIETI